MFFGTKKPDRETVLLLDVESGSVGSALALLARGQSPKLFGETRIFLPAAYSRDSAALLAQVERAAREALVNAAQVAARLRSNTNVSSLGDVARVAVFFSAPWGAPDLSAGTQRFASPLQRSLEKEIEGYLGVGTRYYTGADSASYGMTRLLPGEPIFVCVVRGETAELLLIGESGVQGYATVPTGFNTVLRTLRSHGGLSDAESQSMFELAMHPATAPFEPLDAAARHFVEEFAGAAQHLLGGAQTVNGIFVIAPGAAGEWFARTLGADESLGAYFPQGGTVRALRARHLASHMEAHRASPDLHLLLETLFVGAN